MFINKYFVLLLSSLVFYINISATNIKRPWTVLVYIAADNDYYADADLNIAQMLEVSASTNIYILVYLNIKRTNESKRTQKLIIQDGHIQKEDLLKAEDSGNENTLINALSWAVSEYPSDYLFVNLWNHGSNALNRNMIQQLGVCYDESTNNYLTDLNYKYAFDVIVNKYLDGKKIDVIAFDSCLMANIEVAFTLQPYTNYLVSSQKTIAGPGYDYQNVLSLFVDNIPDPLTLASWLVTSYRDTQRSSSYTISAIHLAKLSNLIEAINYIGELLKNYLRKDSDSTLIQIIDKASSIIACPHFDEPTYLDLYTFFENMHNNLEKINDIAQFDPLKLALKNGLNAIEQCVIANAYSTDFEKVHGISIYFADVAVGIEPSYKTLYWTFINPQWIDFLSDYVAMLFSIARYTHYQNQHLGLT